jgi:CRISPR-associated protein Cmr4
MINTKSHAYLIECLSNLHVGSGDNNYGVIDKQVQRDTISNFPIIHSSGLKGALREYFDKMVKLAPEVVSKYFGSSKNEQANQLQGALRFFEAHLLSVPVRSVSDNEVFFRATADSIVDYFNSLSVNLNCKSVIKFPVSTSTAQTEYEAAPLFAEIDFIGSKAVKFSTSQMNSVMEHLPVIARNSLDNGVSENLWYEEVVPRESRFYFFVSVPSDMNDSYLEDINKNLHEKIVQIGGNATVGYGLCKITKMSES